MPDVVIALLIGCALGFGIGYAVRERVSRERPPPSRAKHSLEVLIARIAAGAFGFLIFNHAFDGPDLYGASNFFDTMPSRPSLQTDRRPICQPPIA